MPFPTLIDLAKVSHNGDVMDVVQTLTEHQDLLKDAPYFPANDTTSHVIARTTSLPQGTWRMINSGLNPTRGTERQLREEIGLLESRSEIDEQLILLAGQPEQFVRLQDLKHVEGLSQQIATTIMRGNNITVPASFNGFWTRINALAQTDGAGRNMVFSYTGAGATQSSMLLVQWGPGQAYMVYPKNHPSAGLEVRKRGLERVVDGAGQAYYANVTRFVYNAGLVIEDDRCVRRVANIQSAGVADNLLDAAFGLDPLIDALLEMKDRGAGATIYMNRAVWGQFWKVTQGRVNVVYQPDDAWKQPRYFFDGIPIRFTDSLLTTEAAVV